MPDESMYGNVATPALVPAGAAASGTWGTALGLRPLCRVVGSSHAQLSAQEAEAWEEVQLAEGS